MCAELFEWAPLLGLFNWFSVIEGAIFLLLAYFAHRASVIAVVVGAALYILDTIALLFAGNFSVIRLIILAVLIRAVLAANMLRQQSKAAVPGQDQSRAA